MTHIASRATSFPPWVACAIIALVVPLAALWFLWPSPLEFPMDDTYIHLVYAQNLAEQGKLMFNTADEKGVGSTSLLWVLLLAGGHAAGLSMHVLAKTLGIASLLTVGIGLYLLLSPLWRPLPTLLGVLLVVLSGHMIWFALSGMETMLFLALGALALLLYQKGRWGWLGFVLGLLTLTRPEGAVLAITIALVETWRHKEIRRGIVVAGLMCLLTCGPWFAYLLWRTGRVIPTSGVGKQFSMALALRLAAERTPALAWIGRFPAVTYPVLWLVYLLEFVLGGMALPPPRISAGTILGNEDYTLSVWAIVGIAGVVAPLLWAALKRMIHLCRRPNWLRAERRRAGVALLAWTVLHNACYMAFLPAPGTASRYGALNHIVLWLALAVGLESSIRRHRLWPWLAIGLGIIAVANTVYWNGVYDANLDHMQNARIAAAHFLRQELAPDSLCAAYDVGAIRYHSQRPIVDLGGLLEPDASRYFLENRVDQYLVERGVTCVVLPSRAGATDEGWFDLAEILGLSNSSLIEMHQVAVFEIDRARWLQGYLPTANYQAAVTIYRLDLPPD
jgi:hypothetical protein